MQAKRQAPRTDGLPTQFSSPGVEGGEKILGHPVAASNSYWQQTAYEMRPVRGLGFSTALSNAD